MTTSAERFVFVNCPFDEEYKDMFRAMVFVIYKCNFRPRCTLETDDAGENRFEKIVKIVGECGYGIHDISRTELNENNLPRFNMPLELGVFLGARKFGTGPNQLKKCLIFDRELFRYQEFISDIAGQDIKSHDGCTRKLVIEIRNWLATYNPGLVGGNAMWSEYQEFRQDLPELCEAVKLVDDELTFMDHTRLVYAWLQDREASQPDISFGPFAIHPPNA